MGLATEIRNAVNGISSFFSGGSMQANYPWVKEFNAFLNSPDTVRGIQDRWAMNLGYSFVVMKENSGYYEAYPEFTEIFLNLNPQNIQMLEPFAKDIVATQTGVVIQHSGSVFKDIIISGTTGVHPKRGNAGVVKGNLGNFLASRGYKDLDGNSTNKFQTSELEAGENRTQLDWVPSPLRGGTGILNGEPPGFVHFHMLKNYIRSYEQFKANAGATPSSEYNNKYRGDIPNAIASGLVKGSTSADNPSEAVLVFRNRKDGESWVVEVLQFTMVRNINSPMTYNYVIHMRALKKISVKAEDKKIGWFDKLLGGLETVENVVTYASEAIDIGAGIITQTADYAERIFNGFNETVNKPIRSIANCLGAIQTAKAKIIPLPRNFVQETRLNIDKVRRRAEDLAGKSSSAYNSIVGRTDTTNGNANERDFTDKDWALMAAMDSWARALDRLLATDLPFSTTAGKTSPTALDAFDPRNTAALNTSAGQFTLTSTAAELANLFTDNTAIPIPNSVQEVILNRGETLEDVALRTLGDATRWYEIAMVNGLKYPYIDTVTDKSLGVIAAGSKIYIPSNKLITNNKILRTRNSYLSNKLTPLERFLGVDIKLTPEFDIKVSNNNDVALAYGVENAAQALNINLSLEKNSLKWHPYKGINLEAGTKSMSRCYDILESIKISILSDPRFDNVSNVSLFKDGNLLYLNMWVSVAAVGKEIPLQTSL